jgi:uncharacterized protein
VELATRWRRRYAVGRMSNSRRFKRSAKQKKPLTLTTEQLEDWFSNCDGPAPCVSMLDGYLAAIIVSPEFVPPHIWLRAIVSEELVDAPDHTLEGVVRNTIFKRYNQISSTLTGGPKRYAPIFRRTDNEEVLLEPYADGFWHGMRLSLDDWKPFISNRDIGMPLTAILGHCTTMINDEDRAAVLTPMAKELLAESWRVVPELVEMLHATLAGSRNIEIR